MAKKLETKKETVKKAEAKEKSPSIKEDNVSKIAVKSTKKKLSEFTVDELIIYLQAIKVVLEKYEKVAKNYDNRFVNEHAVVFHKYLNMYNKTVLEIEKKIFDNIDFENE